MTGHSFDVSATPVGATSAEKSNVCSSNAPKVWDRVNAQANCELIAFDSGFEENVKHMCNDSKVLTRLVSYIHQSSVNTYTPIETCWLKFSRTLTSLKSISVSLHTVCGGNGRLNIVKKTVSKHLHDFNSQQFFI